MFMLKTKNLHLLPVEQVHKEAFSSSKNELAALLQVTVPES
jgi:[ribosomal protein S5]-alanine N-acetyltransferase